MGNPVQNQRYFFFQIHCGINMGCLVIALISILALRFSMGLIEFIALISSIVGICSYFMNEYMGRRRKIVRGYYLVCNLASVISIIFIAQLLFRFVVISSIYRFIYFGMSIIPVAFIMYFIFYGEMRIISFLMNPLYLIGGGILGLILAGFIFNLIIVNLFGATFLIFISYIFTILSLFLGLLVALDIRLLLYKGR
ncbi:MAG: hypothetical protein ACRCST_13285 [Turicibacter sp.]